MPYEQPNYSDEVQEIITDTPSWLLSWGLTVFFFLLVSLVFFSALIKMPDKIVLSGWMRLRKALPNDSEVFLKCILDYNEIPNVKQIESYLNKTE